MRLLILALVVLFSACGPKQYHTAVVANSTLAQSLFALQDAEIAAHNAKLIPNDKHAVYKTQILALLEAGDDLTLALRNWDPSKPVPANVGQAITSVQALLTDLHLESPTLSKVIFAAQTVLSILRGSGVLPSEFALEQSESRDGLSHRDAAAPNNFSDALNTALDLVVRHRRGFRTPEGELAAQRCDQAGRFAAASSEHGAILLPEVA